LSTSGNIGTSFEDVNIDATPVSGSLILWFIYSIVVGIVAGYIAGHALRVGRSPAGRPADFANLYFDSANLPA
jgi:hypothetical protein